MCACARLVKNHLKRNPSQGAEGRGQREATHKAQQGGCFVWRLGGVLTHTHTHTHTIWHSMNDTHPFLEISTEISFVHVCYLAHASTHRSVCRAHTNSHAHAAQTCKWSFLPPWAEEKTKANWATKTISPIKGDRRQLEVKGSRCQKPLHYREVCRWSARLKTHDWQPLTI